MKLEPGADLIDLWKNRRRMAYFALAGLFLITLAAMTRDLSPANADLLNGLAYTFGGIVIAYTGGVVLDAASKRKSDVTSDVAGVPRTAAGRRRETAEDTADRKAMSHPAKEGD